MSVLSRFIDDVPRAQRMVAPNCCVCNRLVSRVSADLDISGNDVLLQFFCHGKVERLTVSESDIRKIVEHEVAVFDVLPKRVFLRNWARYATTTKPPRRVL